MFLYNLKLLFPQKKKKNLSINPNQISIKTIIQKEKTFMMKNTHTIPKHIF